MNTVPTAISYPYKVSPYGVVYTATNSAKIYLDRALTLLSTSIGQRPMLPAYGVDWSRAMFENDGDSQKAIQAAIKTAISTWMPEVTVDSVEVQYNIASGIESAKVALILPDSTIITVPLSTAYINVDGTIA